MPRASWGEVPSALSSSVRWLQFFGGEFDLHRQNWKFEVMMPDESLIYSSSKPFEAHNDTTQEIFAKSSRTIQKGA